MSEEREEMLKRSAAVVALCKQALEGPWSSDGYGRYVTLELPLGIKEVLFSINRPLCLRFLLERNTSDYKCDYHIGWTGHVSFDDSGCGYEETIIAKDDLPRFLPDLIRKLAGEVKTRVNRLLADPLEAPNAQAVENAQSKLQIRKTARGFALAEFADHYGSKCSIQDSSLATEHCIWLGCDQHFNGHAGGRMHLTRAMAKDLIPLLRRFVLKGSIEP